MSRRVRTVDAAGQGCSTDRSTGSLRSGGTKENAMHGYVTRKRDRYYAVIYEGLDPITGRERRTWHPAGTDRAEAERLAARLAAECNGRNDEVRSLTFGAYLTQAVAARQEAHPGDEHLPQLRAQDRAPHPPRPRHDPAPRPATSSPRDPLRPDAAPQRWSSGAGTQVGVRGAPHHPRRPRRRRPPRSHHPQRRPRGPRPAASVDPQGRAAGMDRRAACGHSCEPQPATACSPPCGCRP